MVAGGVALIVPWWFTTKTGDDLAPTGFLALPMIYLGGRGLLSNLRRSAREDPD